MYRKTKLAAYIKNEISPFISLQYTPKPCQEDSEDGLSGFCFVCVCVFKSNKKVHTKFEVSFFLKGSMEITQSQNGSLSDGRKTVQTRREAFIHALQLFTASPISTSDG